MTNFEYVNKRRAESSTMATFSTVAEQVFSERNGNKGYPGNILDWLNETADIALDFPVGTLIQYDDISDSSHPERSRENVYGIVIALHEFSGYLRCLAVSTTDYRGRSENRFVYVDSNHVHKADVPGEILTILKAQLEASASLKEDGNTIPKS